MNFLSAHSPEFIRQITTRVPAKLLPGGRLSVAQLSPFQLYSDRAEFRRLGVELGPCDPEQPTKTWADPDATPTIVKTYNLLTAFGVETVKLDGAIAGKFNLPGLPIWPIPDRLAESRVRYEIPSEGREGIITADKLATIAEVNWILADVGTDFEAVSASQISPKVKVIIPEGENRAPWSIARKGRISENYPVGSNIQSQFVGTAKGAPGHWSIDPVQGLRYTMDTVPDRTNGKTMGIPVEALPEGAVIEAGAFGGITVSLPALPAEPPVFVDPQIAECLAILRRLEAKANAGDLPW